jgi:dienelactone hydrolase
VGETTLDLGSAGDYGDRLTSVFYPADPRGLAGHSPFTYQLAAPLPPALAEIIPAKYNATVRTDAYVDTPASHDGPFPIVLFSHGDGGSRLYYSHLLTGIASWGFVVASADYLERGIVAQATHSTESDTPSLDLQTMLASLATTEAAATNPSSPLFGVADAGKTAAIGHSAGGQTAFDALNDPRIATAVGWAPVGPHGPPSHKPVMIIGEQEDVALTPATLTREFDDFPGPTDFIEIGGEGHNTYTDVCPSIRAGGGGLVGFAMSLHLIPSDLARLAINGCTDRNLPPQRFWPIVQSYTVAQLRHTFGHEAMPGPPASGQFPGFSIGFRQHR